MVISFLIKEFHGTSHFLILQCILYEQMGAKNVKKKSRSAHCYEKRQL